MEVWKPISGYLKHYEVSTKDRVRSVNRTIRMKNGKIRKLKEKVLKPALTGTGYLGVNLSIKGCTKTHKVHILVSNAFFGKRGKRVINHIDGNKLNNTIHNLELISQSENIQHAFDNGLNVAKRGSENGKAKINEDVAKKIKFLLSNGKKKSFIARSLGVTYDIVNNISRNRTWRHV